MWLRLMLPLGCVGRKCPQLCLSWGAVHPIRRHDTPSDRVYRDVTGASRRNGCSATERVQCDGSGVARTVSSTHRTRARAGATCVNGAAGLRRRTTNRGEAQASRLGPLPMSYERGYISA